MNNLRLYVDSQLTSPYATSAFVVLREKGIEFELIPVDLEASENQSADYASLSLTQRVPTLIHGDFALSESSAITEYLEEVFPESPVYPKIPGSVQKRGRFRHGFAVTCYPFVRSAPRWLCSMASRPARYRQRPSPQHASCSAQHKHCLPTAQSTCLASGQSPMWIWP